MPRHPRLFIPGAIYHVCCRVARGEFGFDDDCEAIEFVETLREIRDLDRRTILAWCLMGNHYHLVIKTRTVDLWRSMARLQGRISRSHNRRNRYLGRLWQSRYRARVIDRYRLVSGRDLEELASRHRSTEHIRGRIELCVLAISRYGFRACDIAALLGKGRNSITRRLSKGLVKERDDPDFAARIDSLESSISQR